MRIAFIGLGAMGSLMAEQLAKVPEIDLVLYDLDQERLQRAAALGEAAGSVAEAATGADAVFSVVPADRHVQAVVDDLEPVAREGMVFVDFSTIGPETIEAVEARLGRRGVTTVSAGMTQSIEGASTGTLRLFVGGPAELPAAIVPAMDALTEEVRLVGGVGAAKALKLVNNMVVAVLDVAICEALVLGERLGLDYEATTTALREGGADSWPLGHHIVNHVLPDDLGTGFFSTRFLIKDMTLCMAFLASFGLPATLAGIATSFYRGTVAIGHGDDYHMVVVRWLERGAGFVDKGKPPETAAGEQPDPDAVAAALVDGVRAVQALVCLEALDVLGKMGVERLAAAEHLEAGSAGNDALRSLIAGEGGMPPVEIVTAAEAALTLAAGCAVPATMFEVARHLALGIAQRRGPEADLWMPETPAPAP